jgi:hypothetical protein
MIRFDHRMSIEGRMVIAQPDMGGSGRISLLCEGIDPESLSDSCR